MRPVDWLRATRRRAAISLMAVALMASAITWTLVIVFQPDPLGTRAEQAELISRTVSRDELTLFACAIVESNEGRARVLSGVPGQEAETRRARRSAEFLRALIETRLHQPCGPPGRATDLPPEEAP